MGERTWQISAESFFQVNTEQAEQLLAVVRRLAGPLHGDETLLDAYAGVGLFGITLAGEVAHSYLVESHPAAVADARRHATGNPTITVIQATAEEALPNWADYGPPPQHRPPGSASGRLP